MNHTHSSTPPDDGAVAHDTAPDSTTSSARKVRRLPRFDHADGSPRARAMEHRLAALAIANRFRVIRVIDIAAGLFAHRAFKAALSAAQRTVGRLVDDRLLTRYRSLSGQTYYGLAARGASLLRESGVALEAEPSASRASERTNPEHSLWIAFAVLCCQSRGIRALTEGELLVRLGHAADSPASPLRYSPDGRGTKRLIPDAVGFDGSELAWFEIDRSARGSARLDDLVGLVGRMGAAVALGATLRLPMRRVVIWCKTPGILRRNRTHLTGTVVRNGARAPRLHVDIARRPALRHLGDDIYEVSRDVTVRLPDGREAVQTVVAGCVHLQLLPRHLLSYSYRQGQPSGWFDDGSLPFKHAWADAAAESSSPE